MHGELDTASCGQLTRRAQDSANAAGMARKEPDKCPALVWLCDELAVDPEVVPPTGVNAVERDLDAFDVSAEEAVVASFENLPQRYIRQVLERVNDSPTHLVLGPKCDHKLAHALRVGASS